MPEHQDHIFRSMLGFGSNGYPTSVLLNRNIAESDRNFLDCVLPTADGKCRDEYPYNSTYQGGEANYNAGKVSVEYVSSSESTRQGLFIRWFYEKTNLTDRESFIVIPLGPANGWFDKNGKWRFFPGK